MSESEKLLREFINSMEKIENTKSNNKSSNLLEKISTVIAAVVVALVTFGGSLIYKVSQDTNIISYKLGAIQEQLNDYRINKDSQINKLEDEIEDFKKWRVRVDYLIERGNKK